MVTTTTTTISFNPAGAFLDSWFRAVTQYQQAMQANTQKLMLGPASNVQEQGMHAFMTAWQGSAEAFMTNMMNLQRQYLEWFAEASRQAMGMMGGQSLEAWTGALRPAR
ncbi:MULTISPECIES: hypothetical protein [unclassified Massilia]|uniref:hypothetical protein n=1 Tax=unclassified Massilia TaxID=2609279 RepID=UPI0012E24706|nr:MULTISPECIES: hypothetical protein [unclassified Massilia]